MPLETPILVVDDSYSMRVAIRQILKSAGYQDIILAEDGAVGLRHLKTSLTPGSQKVGLVLSDWTMPNMTGIDLLENMRKNNKLSDVCFVMVTNEKRTDRILEAIKKGANDFIFKPFPSALLIEKVNKLLLATG